MIKKGEPFLIEYNIRMGDPECQVILPRLKSDFLKIIVNAVNNNLNQSVINWKKEKSMTIVLCSKGYPGNYKKYRLIKNIQKLKKTKNQIIFHAGTKNLNGNIFSNGGRVLNFTSLGLNFSNIRDQIIKQIKILNWKDGFFRSDIGWRVIKK